MSTHLEARAERLRREYRSGDMTMKDIAREEDCSVRTIERRVRMGDYGPVFKHNRRVVRVTVEGYIAYLSTKTVVLKASA